MNTDSEYEKQLADWKARHGLDPKRDQNQDELLMLAEEHASKGTTWCFGCDKEMPIAQMKLITRAIDPYLQTDEGETDYIAKSHRTRMCPECFAERYQQVDL